NKLTVTALPSHWENDVKAGLELGPQQVRFGTSNGEGSASVHNFGSCIQSDHCDNKSTHRCVLALPTTIQFGRGDEIQAVNQRGKVQKYSKDIIAVVAAVKRDRESADNIRYRNIRSEIKRNMALSVSPSVKGGPVQETMAVLETAALVAELVMLFPEETPTQIKNRMQTCQESTG
ncbi:hypothetical protein H0H93_005118, partial [Arthromyces matolae]